MDVGVWGSQTTHHGPPARTAPLGVGATGKWQHPPDMGSRGPFPAPARPLRRALGVLGAPMGTKAASGRSGLGAMGAAGMGR